MAKTLVMIVAAIAMSHALSLTTLTQAQINEPRRTNETPAEDRKLTIHSVDVRFAGDDPATLLVKGKNFGTISATLKLSDVDLTDDILLWADTMIEADLLSHTILPAAYLVKVYSGVAPVSRDEMAVTIGAVGPEGPPGSRGEKGDPGPPGPIPFVGMSCPEGDVLVGFDASGQLICQTLTTPPADSSIIVSGNPTTIALGSRPECSILLHLPTCGSAEVVATVSNALGVPLPGQDVRFTNTAGLLFTGTVSNPMPISGLPVLTDQFGNARVNLVTATTATVTARSGTAMGNLTFNTVQGNLSAIILNNDTTQPGCGTSTTNVTSCNQTVCLVTTALDTSGSGLPGIVLNFNLQNNTVLGNRFNGTFNPAQPTTDANGDAFTTFTSDATCDPECSVALGGRAMRG